MPDFKPVNSDDKIFDELVPVLIGIGPKKNLLCYGTCFIASPFMAVTAKHVVEELLNQDPEIALTGTANFEYWIVQVVWRGTEFDYVVWAIQVICTAPHSDIATIWLRPYNTSADEYRQINQWKTMPITFDPPEPGETVRAFGIHSVTFNGSRVNDDGKFEHVEIQTKKSIATGVVRMHYWDKRDSALYNFPCFEVDAKFESGMSGGLVINERSQICGIVCGSLHASSEDEPHVSYVTMLWPMLAIPVPNELVSDAQEAVKYRLQDMSHRKVFNPQGWERVLIQDLPGGESSIQYLRLSLATNQPTPPAL